MAWVEARPSRRMGNLTSQLPTMFWILNSCSQSVQSRGAALVSNGGGQQAKQLSPLATSLPGRARKQQHSRLHGWQNERRGSPATPTLKPDTMFTTHPHLFPP